MVIGPVSVELAPDRSAKLPILTGPAASAPRAMTGIASVVIAVPAVVKKDRLDVSTDFVPFRHA
jgi:hypothetical protein